MKYLTILSLILIAACTSEMTTKQKIEILPTEYPLFINENCPKKTVKFYIKNMGANDSIEVFIGDKHIPYETLRSNSTGFIGAFDISASHSGQNLMFRNKSNKEEIKRVSIEKNQPGDIVEFSNFAVDMSIDIVNRSWWPGCKDLQFDEHSEYEIRSKQHILDKLQNDKVERTFSLSEVEFVDRKTSKSLQLPPLTIKTEFEYFPGVELVDKIEDYTKERIYEEKYGTIKSTLNTSARDETVKPFYLVQARKKAIKIKGVQIDCQRFDTLYKKEIYVPNYVQVGLN